VVLPDDQRQQAQKAREAAEALFRPKIPNVPENAPTADTAPPPSPAEHEATRRPRVLRATSSVMASANRDDPAAAGELKSQRARRKARRISPSAYGRVRALVTYGMTMDDVADLYGVPVGEIERIVAVRDSSDASAHSRD
jgi:hypothetical protein